MYVVAKLARETKVGNLEGAVLANEQVRGLDIAMHDIILVQESNACKVKMSA